MPKLSTYALDSATAIAAARLAGPLLNLSGTELTISNLPAIIGDFDTDLSGVTMLSFPDLVELVGKFTPTVSALTTLDLSALVTLVGEFHPVESAAIIAMDLSSLAFVGGSFNVAGLSSMTSLDLSALTTVGTLISIGGGGSFRGSASSLISIDLTSLAVVQNHFDPQFASLASLTLPAITSIGGDFDIYSEEIATLTLNSGLKKIGGLVSLEQVGKLNQASIDGILVRLAALDGTSGTTSFDNKTIDLSGGTNATPSATGLAAKATLEGRGNTVTVN